METTQKLKNDGTDPRKNDGGAVGAQATDRTCYMRIYNLSGYDITDVVLVHSSGDERDEIKQASMTNGQYSYNQTVNYETGWWADFDYWDITFSINGTVYTNPNSDYCNIDAEDAGQVITCEIDTEDVWGGDYNLKIRMPKSSNCDFKIDKVS